MPARKDLTGLKFHRLTLLRCIGRNSHKQRLWECLCECGTKIVIPGQSAVSGNTKSCGCIQRSPDMAGQRFGRLLVLKQVQERKSGGIAYLCRCDCGKEVLVTGSWMRQGNTRSCGCLLRDTYKLPKKRLKFSVPPQHAAKHIILGQYKNGAADRSLSWELSDENFFELVSKDCHYCGEAPTRIVKGRRAPFVCNGLDRVDNHLGYMVSNVVPCCKKCNNGKKTLSREEFLIWIEKVYNHQNQKTLIKAV